MYKSQIYRLRPPVLYLQLVILTGFLMLQFSCSYFYTKEKYLRDYDAFVTNIENNVQNINPTKWDEAILEYDRFNSELYNSIYSELTPEDQQTIGKLKARFEKLRLKYQLEKLMDGMKDGLEQIKGVVKDI